MSRWILFFTFSFIWVIDIQAANILAVFPFQAKSHAHMAERLLKRLAERGHNVEFATHYPSKKHFPRYQELSLAGSLPLFVNNLSVHYYEGFSRYDTVKFIARRGGVEACQAIFNTPALKEIRKAKKKYDVVITQIFGSECILGFASMFNASIISIVSSIDLPWGGARVGNCDNPSYIPNYFSYSTSKMSFFERVENTLLWIITKALYRFFSLRDSNTVVQNFFGPQIPDLDLLVQNTSLVFANSHFSVNGVRPSVPSFVEIGGLHITEPKSLSQHFANIVNTTEGIIYVSMGSMLMTETFDLEKLQGMFDALGELPNTVLWKADVEKFSKILTIPKNIYFEKWMPQIDILCHPNVELFVTHGGGFGSQEAVYCGVPRLGIPFFADQEANVLNCVKMGIAVKLDYEDITKESMLKGVKQILEDPTYKRNTQKISLMFRNRPISPLDSAVFWIEYIIRRGGSSNLKIVGNLSWYQYYLVDVVIVTVLGLATLLYTCQLLLKILRH